MPGDDVQLGVVTMSLFSFIPVFVPYLIIHSHKGIFVQILIHLYYVTYTC